MNSKDINIRFANRADLPEIVEIYNQAIRSNTATGDLEEFLVKEKEEWFSSFSELLYPIYVAECDSKVVAYCSVSPYRPGRGAMKSIAEISYYVHKNYFRKGIGRKLLKYALQNAQRIEKKVFIAILLDKCKVN